jgi:hypothetical protein
MMLIEHSYAYRYGNPLIFCYDGHCLLILQFQAESRDDIKKASCPIDVMAVPRSSLEEDRCTVRDAIYRVTTQGIRRCLGLSADPLVVGGYPRGFVYYSGRPYFITAQGRHFAHPLGYQREFDLNALRWKWVLGEEQVFDTKPFD